MSVSSDKKPMPRGAKIFVTIVGWLFNIIWIGAFVLVIASATGSRKSSEDAKMEVPTNVQNVR